MKMTASGESALQQEVAAVSFSALTWAGLDMLNGSAPVRKCELDDYRE